MLSRSDIVSKVTISKGSLPISTVICETLQLQRRGRWLVGLCPFHRERTPSFTVYDDHYHCFGCGAHGDVIDWIMQIYRTSFPDAVKRLADRAGLHQIGQGFVAPESIRANRNPPTDLFLRCWQQGTDPTGTIVETYLRSRGGLWLPDGAPIRFHPRCQRGGKDLSGGPEYWPAMLALMTEPITGRPVGLHRTYLLPDGSGKAPVTMRGGVVLKPKMILGTWGVVRLAPDEDVGRALAITEGIENALTAMQVIGWGPAWAAGTQDCIRALPVLPGIEAVTIFADADDNGVGLAAARSCARRWYAAGREAVIQIPPPGQDWNDTARGVPHEPA